MKPFFLWFLLSLALFAGPTRADEPTLTVGIYDNPPQVFQDAEGSPRGIYVDLIREIARLEGWRITFVWGTWAKHLDALKRGKLDLITTIAYDAGRDRYVDYSQEPVVTLWGQIYQKPGLSLRNILDLEGKRIAVMKNGLFGIRLGELCNKFQVGCVIIPVPGYRDAMQAISEGRAEAAAINSLFGYAFEHEFKVTRSAIIYEPFGLRFAAPEGAHAGILTAIDARLKAWKRDNNSFYFRTLAHYAGGHVSSGWRFPPWLIWLLVAGGGALLLFFLWSLSLRIQVAARTREVEERTHQLTETNRELEAFSYSVAHDLRAPLSNAEGFTRILVEDHRDALNQEGRDYLAWLENSLRQMKQRIGDYLNLARSNRTTMQRRSVDISQLAEKTAMQVQAMIPQIRDVEIVIQPGLRGDADPDLLGIVLENLISNAIKFSAPRERPRIAIGSAAGPKGEREFFVRDNGVGFDPMRAERLFQPFERFHALEQFEGSGVGLATVKRIVQRHGGRIRAESVPDEGTTLFFTLGTDENQDSIGD